MLLDPVSVMVATNPVRWAGDELLSFDDREAVATMHAEGMSASRIAAQLDISRESVLRRLTSEAR